MIDVASSREEFVARAVNHTVVPVRTALVSDDDTPVGAMTIPSPEFDCVVAPWRLRIG